MNLISEAHPRSMEYSSSGEGEEIESDGGVQFESAEGVEFEHKQRI